MKTSTAVFLIAVMTWCNIGVDAFSFNLSGAFNPGITFGVRPQRKYQLRNYRYEDSDWPQPENVNNYNVPKYVSKPLVNPEFDNKEKPHTQTYGSNHRNLRH